VVQSYLLIEAALVGTGIGSNGALLDIGISPGSAFLALDIGSGEALWIKNLTLSIIFSPPLKINLQGIFNPTCSRSAEYDSF